ncbi:MAG: GNAT family N-acetyltransferase, partial [Acidobacteria bacterium]|nr:GNAT family N-acetyltransferase [Acidobacteriota bacterium]
GTAVACGALRRLGPDTSEVKRMYVRPAFRGRGLARRILAELEETARRRGAARIWLETGIRQP